MFNPHCRVHVIGKNFPLAHEFSAYLLNNEVGIVTYHCPELTSGGYNRNPQGMIQYDNVFFRQHCEKMLEVPLLMIQEFINNGYRLCAVVGLQNSPSCGVRWGTHKRNKYNEESWMESEEESTLIKKGILMQVLESKFDELNIEEIPMIEFPTSSPLGSKEHIDFWYEIRKAVEPRNPYISKETANDFRAYFIQTTHHNDDSIPYVESRRSKVIKEKAEQEEY